MSVGRRIFTFQRMARGSRLVHKGLTDSRGLGGKWGMFLSIARHVRLQLGRPGKPREASLILGSLRIVVDVSRGELTPYWEIWHENAYEMLPGFKPSENGCVVDVGGNIGFYAVRQAARVRAGRVLVFEPSPTAFSRLKRNLQENRLTNVMAVNAAVGSSPGTVYFVEKPVSLNCRVVNEKTEKAVSVPCTTLDIALPQAGISRVDVLKIDTEGHETAVLAGARAMLPYIERVVLELHNRPDEQKRLIDDILRPAGLKPVLRYRSLVYYERS